MRIIAILLAIILTLESHSFTYFDTEIDYWRMDNPPAKTPRTTKSKKEGFDWTQYLDPRKDQFFKEGNYSPPKPFMELARNPTDQNIKNWFRLIEKKNKITIRLQKNIKKYLQKNSLKINEQQEILKTTTFLSGKSPPNNYKRYRLRLYFDSTCSYCTKMMTTMHKLSAKGYFIELRQIDNNLEYSRGLPFPIKMAKKEELKRKNINSWPVLFAGDLHKKVIYRINGFKTSEQVITFLNSK